VSQSMREIAGTGYFYRFNSTGTMSFAKFTGSRMQDLSTRGFTQAFGFEVNSENARKEAQSILDEYNATSRSSYSLAPFGGKDARAS